MGVVFDRLKRLAKGLVKKKTPQEKLNEDLHFYAANSSSPWEKGYSASGKDYFKWFLEAINQGADPNYFDGDNSVLLWAVSHSGIKAAVWMCEHAKEYGIDLNKKSNWHDYEDNTALILAVKKGWDHTPYPDIEVDKRVAFSKKSGGWDSSPYPGKDLDRQSQVIKALLRNGADPNLQDWKGNTALHVAILKREIPSIKILLKHGARLDIKNNAGKLPEDMLKENYRGINEYLHEECGDSGLCVYVHTLQNHESWEKALAPIQEMIQKHKKTPPDTEPETTRWRQGAREQNPPEAPLSR